MQYATVGVPFEAIYRKVGADSDTIPIDLYSVSDSGYSSVDGSPISMLKVEDGEYLFSYTFSDPGGYFARQGNTTSNILVSEPGISVEDIENSDVLSDIRLRISNLPIG